MQRTRPFLLASTVLFLAACGSASASGSSATTTAAAAQSSQSAGSTAGTGSLDLVTTSKYGKVLGSSTGSVYYMFSPDTKTTSACSGGCVAAWPPVAATSATGSGVQSGLLGFITRTDGTKQLSYNGHPLYTFAGDTVSGATNGEGLKAFGGSWYLLNSAGVEVKASITGSSTPTSAGSYY